MRAVVVGAGLSGLAAAGRLAAAGHDVVVFEKAPSVGGRMASRRIGDALFDHGAQFFTVRSDEFAAFVAPHLRSGLVREWCRGFGEHADGYSRYAVRGGMVELCRALAEPLDVRCDSMVFAIRHGTASRWEVVIDDGTSVPADVLVMTAPIAQSYSLLVSADIELPRLLARTEYDRTIALLVVLDGPSDVPEPGGRQHPNDVLSFATDNQRKGISAVPAVTLHGNAAFSETHWNDDPDALTSLLLDAGTPLLGPSPVLETQLKRWRFATPRTIWPDPCWVAEDPTVVVAGDAFAGPKVEGAVLSGLAAAGVLLS